MKEENGRVTSLHRFVCEIKNFVLYSLIYIRPVKRSKNGSDMMKFRNFGDGTNSRTEKNLQLVS